MNLTPVEQAIYDKLLELPDCAPLHILKEIQPPASKRESNIVAVHIKNIRRKIKEDGMEIINIRGFGYKLVKSISLEI